MKKTEIFYTVYNGRKDYIGCSKDKDWAEYTRQKYDGYIIASGKYIENPEVIEFKHKRLVKRIENTMWLTLSILGLLGAAQNFVFGNTLSAIGFIAMGILFLYVFKREKNRFN
jgi:hypothetical protein